MDELQQSSSADPLIVRQGWGSESSKPGRSSSSIDLRGCVCQEGNSEGSRTMDETKTREHVQAHAEAVERGDMDAVVADFSEELQPQVPEIAKALPQPVTSAEVVGLEVGEGEGVALIRYCDDRGIRRPKGATLHTTKKALEPSEIVSREGIRATDPVRSILDAAGAGTAPEQIEMAVRQALEEGLTTRRALLARADRRAGRAVNRAFAPRGATVLVRCESAKDQRPALSGRLLRQQTQ